eukprot:3997652-Lingulodinium_polyedra.AAC.1
MKLGWPSERGLGKQSAGRPTKWKGQKTKGPSALRGHREGSKHSKTWVVAEKDWNPRSHPKNPTQQHPTAAP